MARRLSTLCLGLNLKLLWRGNYFLMDFWSHPTFTVDVYSAKINECVYTGHKLHIMGINKPRISGNSLTFSTICRVGQCSFFVHHHIISTPLEYNGNNDHYNDY